MWKLTQFGRTRSPLSGVPWRDLSDEEFAAVEAAHPTIRDRGYFEEVVSHRRRAEERVTEESGTPPAEESTANG